MSSEEEEFNDSGDESEGEIVEDEDDGAYEENDADDNNDDDDDDDDDDVPLSSLRHDSKPPIKSRAAKVTPESDDDDDDDDDIPLAALKKNSTVVSMGDKKRKTPTKKAEPVIKKVKTSSPKKTSNKDSKAKKTGTTKNGKKTANGTKSKKSISGTATSTTNGSSSGGSSKSYEFASAALYGTECNKGLLIQRLLCRWWYAITWPDPSAVPVNPPPKYDSLDGFPGVFVCTAGDKVGELLDLRDKSQAPTFANFARKSADELRRLLLSALENQKQALIQVEGTGTATEKELQSLIRWATKLSTSAADKEADKVLKAHKLKLPQS